MCGRTQLLVTAAFVVLSCTSLGACAHTQSQTNRQLAQGQSVLTGGFTFPGTLGYPRASLQVTQGVNHGDLSAHLGTTGLQLGAGVGGRYYLSDAYHLETALMYRYGLPDVSIPAHVLHPRIGLSSATTPDQKFYWGTGVHAYIAHGYPDRTSFIHTVNGGYENDLNDNLTGHIEVSLPLWSLHTGGRVHAKPVGVGFYKLGLSNNALYWNSFQVSIGLHWFGL